MLPDQEALEDPAVRQVARLAVLRRMIGNGSRNRAAAREAKAAFRKELDEYVSDARVRAVSTTWIGNDIDVIMHHYGRILALSCAIVLHGRGRFAPDCEVGEGRDKRFMRRLPRLDRPRA